MATGGKLLRRIAFCFLFVGNRIATKVGAAERALMEEQSAAEANSAGSSSGIWAAVDQRLRDSSAGVPNQETSGGLHPQLRAYISGPVVDRSSNPNPLQTWQRMRHGMEYVYELAMEYLPVMVTSVASERLFSHAGLV